VSALSANESAAETWVARAAPSSTVVQTMLLDVVEFIIKGYVMISKKQVHASTCPEIPGSDIDYRQRTDRETINGFF
jgi:hypothetical protein